MEPKIRIGTNRVDRGVFPCLHSCSIQQVVSLASTKREIKRKMSKPLLYTNLVVFNRRLKLSNMAHS